MKIAERLASLLRILGLTWLAGKVSTSGGGGPGPRPGDKE